MIKNVVFLLFVLWGPAVFAQEEAPPAEPRFKITLKNVFCHDPKAILKGDRIYFGCLTQYILSTDNKTCSAGTTPIVGKFKKKVEASPVVTFAEYPKDNRKLMIWSKIQMIRHDSDKSTLHNRMLFTPLALNSDSKIDAKKLDKRSLISFAKEFKAKDGMHPIEKPRDDINTQLATLHHAIDQAEKAFTNKDLWLSEIDLTLVYMDQWVLKHRVGFREEEKELESGVNTLKLNVDGKGFNYDLEFEIVIP